MGINIEFNPDLNLRKSGTRGRKLLECLPSKLIKGVIYSFLKRGQRNYWLDGPIPLQETQGDGKLSRPLAAIQIIDTTHQKIDGEIWTSGRYCVLEVFNPNSNQINFEGMKYIPRER